MLRKRIYAWKNRGMALLLAGLTAFGMAAVPAFAEEQSTPNNGMQTRQKDFKNEQTLR